MRIKTTRTYYIPFGGTKGLEATINEIGYENILQIIPTYSYDKGASYTIIYREPPHKKIQNNTQMQENRAVTS